MAEYSLNPGQPDESIDLSRFLRTLRKRWLVVASISATVFATVAAYTYIKEPVYQSETSLLIDDATISVSNLPVNEGLDQYSKDPSLETEIAILRSRSLVGPAVAQLSNPDPTMTQDEMVEYVLENLYIRQEKGASVLWLTYRDPDPQRAKEVLDSLAAAYSQYSLKDRRSRSSTAIQFIEAKLPQIKKQLDQSALAVTKFREKYKIVDPDTYASSVYVMKQDLDKQSQQLQIQMAQTQRQFKELQRQVGGSTDLVLGKAILAEDITYQNLVKQFQEAETHYYLERTRFQDNHPEVQVAKDRRDQLYKLMQVQAETVLGGKAEQVGVTTAVPASADSSIQQNLAGALFETQTTMAVQAAQMGSVKLAQERVSAIFAQIPQLQQQYTELQRQLELDSAVFTSLSEKLEELRIAEAQEISSWRVLDASLLPLRPIEPNVLRNLVFGGFAGVLFGIAIAMYLERSDERIREVDEVRELTHVPLLGSIPRTDMLELSPVVEREAALAPTMMHSAFREALRSLALNLRYLGGDLSIKSIAFTSAVPSEGKSTLVFNLATILAELGHKVLVVDADMRKPNVHHLARLRNNYGLSTVIATNRSWRQVVQSANVKGCLNVITSGPLPPNPMVLLESTKMTKLLQVWRQAYDYVLIDTPPIVGITDAQCLASKVDSVVLVAAIERSTRSAIARAVEILNGSRANMAGILINMIERNDSSYYYNYYASYYKSNNKPLLPVYAADPKSMPPEQEQITVKH
jgi:succinoglycan biosynthesis transport protein ExoP